MYYFLAIIAGLIIAVMVSINGNLTSQYGVFGATLIIHIVGSIFALLVIRIKKEKFNISRSTPILLYTGGLIGVLTTIFNNLAFGKISLTSIIALSLFGQTVISLIIDCFGLFGMKKYKFKKSCIIGLTFAVAGIFVMMDDIQYSALLAVILSFLTGLTIVVSRTINAKLSEQTGALQSSFINHLVGFLFSIIALFTLGSKDYIWNGFVFSPKIYMYLGGVLGVIIVLLFNITVSKIPAFYLTLLTFVGQVFTGIIIDLITKSGYTKESFFGGLLISLGIGINILIDVFYKFYLKSTNRLKT